MSAPTPAYELTFERHDGYLLAHVTADDITEELVADYLRAIAHKCNSTHSHCLIIDRNIPKILRIGALFLVATEFRRLIGDTRVAFVNPYPEISEALDFGIEVVNNRGADFRLFDDIASAEHWLLSG